MKQVLSLLFAISMVCTSFGQNHKKDQEVDIISHEVQLGESVRMISKKYLVDPAEIYKLNKFAVEGISQGMILKIPAPHKEGVAVKEANTAVKTAKKEEAIVQKEEVQSTEVQSTSEAVIEKKVEKQIVPIPVKKNNEIKKIVITEKKTEVNHKVLPKETLFSLSREFNVSVDDLKASNPEIAKKGLQVGQTILIPTSKEVDIQQSNSVGQIVSEIKPEVKPVKKEVVRIADNTTETVKSAAVSADSNTIKHKVEPKETLYSLSKKYNVTIDEIKNQNADLLKNGLQIGQTLTITTHN